MKTQARRLENLPGHEYTVVHPDKSRPITNQEFLHLLEERESFRFAYNGLLRQSDHPAFYWEHPPLSADNLHATYRFSLIASTTLHGVAADRRPFASHFGEPEPFLVAPNLKKDALLVIPNGKVFGQELVSLADVVRKLPEEDLDLFWGVVAQVTAELLVKRTVYLNTAGDGVSWCHVRLDSRPRYYKNRAYRR